MSDSPTHPVSGFSDQVQKWMRDRATAFARGTQRRGMPMTYGSGDRAKAYPKRKKKR